MTAGVLYAAQVVYVRDWWEPQKRRAWSLTQERPWTVADAVERALGRVERTAVTVMLEREEVPANDEAWRRELPSGATLLVIAMPGGAAVGAFIVESLITAAVATGVNLLLSAVLSPPDQAKDLDDESSPTYGFGGIRTIYDGNGLPIPLLLGRRMVGGIVIAQGTESLAYPDPQTYLNLLLLLCEGPIRSIGGITEDSDELSGNALPKIFIDDSRVENLDDVTASVRLGSSDQSPIPGFLELPTQYAVGIELDQVKESELDPINQPKINYQLAAIWDAPAPADAVSVGIHFPRGLYKLESDGSLSPQLVEVSLRYRELNESGTPVGSYVTIPKEQITIPYASGVPGIQHAIQSPFTHQFKFRLNDPTQYVGPAAGGTFEVDSGNEFLIGPPSGAIEAAEGWYDQGVRCEEFSCFAWVRIKAISTAEKDQVIFKWADGAYDSANGFTTIKGFAIRATPVNLFGLTESHYLLEVYWGDTTAQPATSFFGGVATNVVPHGDLDPAESWHLIGITFKHDAEGVGTHRVRIYIDGALRAEKATTRPVVTASGANGLIALGAGGSSFDSRIEWEHVYLLRRELSASEVHHLWNGGTGLDYEAIADSNTTGFWRWDSSAPDRFTDFGPYGNHLNEGGSFGGVFHPTGGHIPVGGAQFPKRMRVRVELQRETPIQDEGNIQDECEFESAILWQEEAYSYPESALLGLRIRASGQINTTLPNVKTVAEGKALIPQWDGASASAPTYDYAYTRNPAWLVLGLLIETWGLGQFHDGATDIDVEQFQAWADWCDELIDDGREKAEVDEQFAILAFASSNIPGPQFPGALESEGPAWFFALAMDSVIPGHWAIGGYVKVYGFTSELAALGWPPDGTECRILYIDPIGYASPAAALIALEWPSSLAWPPTHSPPESSVFGGGDSAQAFVNDPDLMIDGNAFDQWANTGTPQPTFGKTTAGATVGGFAFWALSDLGALTFHLEQSVDSGDIVDGVEHTFSVFLKAGTAKTTRIRLYDNDGNNVAADVDWTVSPPTISLVTTVGGGPFDAQIDVFDAPNFVYEAKVSTTLSDGGGTVICDIEPESTSGGATGYVLAHGARLIPNASASDTNAYPFGVRYEGVEARQSCDIIYDRENDPAWDAVLRAANAGRGVPIRVGSRVTCKFESARPLTHVFTQANVLSETVRWSGRAPDDEFNTATMSFSNAQKDYARDVVSVDHESLKDGSEDVNRHPKEYSSEAITSPSQALRELTFFLEFNARVWLQVQFEAYLDAAGVVPGDVFLFAHPLPDWGFGGRTQDESAAGDEIVIDRTITIGASDTYYAAVVNKATDDVEVVEVATGAGTYPPGTTIDLVSSLAFTPQADTFWAIGVMVNAVKPFQVIETRLNERRLTKTVVALEYDEAPYTAADSVVLEASTSSEVKSQRVLAPGPSTVPENVEGLRVSEETIVEQRGGTLRTGVVATWRASRKTAQLVDRYVIWARGPRDPRFRPVATVGSSAGLARIEDPRVVRAGLVAVAVQPVTASGLRRAPEFCTQANCQVRGRTRVPEAPSGVSVEIAGLDAVYRVTRSGTQSQAVAIRRGGWFVGVDVATLGPGIREFGPTLDWVDLPEANDGRANPPLLVRAALQNGQFSDAASAVAEIRPPEAQGDVILEHSIEDEGWSVLVDSGAPILRELETDSAFAPQALQWKSGSVALEASYTTTLFDLGESGAVLVHFGIEGEQHHPATLEDTGLSWDDPALDDWTFEGPLSGFWDEQYGAAIQTFVEWRHGERRDPGSVWRPYRPQVVRARSLQFRIRFVRSTTRYDLRLTRAALRVTTPPKDDVLGGTF